MALVSEKNREKNEKGGKKKHSCSFYFYPMNEWMNDWVNFGTPIWHTHTHTSK